MKTCNSKCHVFLTNGETLYENRAKTAFQQDSNIWMNRLMGDQQPHLPLQSLICEYALHTVYTIHDVNESHVPPTGTCLI